MTLAELLAGVAADVVYGDPAVPVTGVRTDARQVQPGEVFVALPGYRTEGGESRADRHAFVEQALDHGAAAVVVERLPERSLPTTVVQVSDGWSAAAALAAAFHGHPSRQLTMIGVTGTSGKTSTTYFIEAVLAAAGRKVARLGTIEYRFGTTLLPALQTTPEADELQRLLRQAVDSGLDTCVMEVSSHALELRRVGAVAFDVAVFTNLSQDHLNFHPDMHAYLRAKGRLFEELASGGKAATAVVNLDDPHSQYILGINSGRLLGYGRAPEAQVRAIATTTGLDGTRLTLLTPEGSADVRLQQLGDYQLHNGLAAAAVGTALAIPLPTIVQGLSQATEIPGRFELIDEGQEFRVAVDYAHKPDALERLLRSGRALGPRRLIVVFGCGGDRDRGKRPQMGRIATALADVVVVTSDNPRSEDPRAIVDEIVAGCEARPGVVVETIVDRAEAIRRAIELAEARDLVLIAGKGHETYQILGERRIHFDDREQARQALRRR